MRASNLTSFVLLAASLPFAAAQERPQPVTSYKKLTYPALNKINVPEQARFVLPNGMVVYLVEDHELPTVGLSAMVRAGARWEPVEKAGLAALTGTVLRTGGSVSRKGDELDRELDRLGAFVESQIGEDSGTVSASALKEDTDRILPIVADLLQNPAFPEDKIELAKMMQRDIIARRNDNPSGIAFREFRRIIFGKESPYGHQPEFATIGSIRRDDLLAFHKQHFQPENIILGAWGDFKTAEMKEKLAKALGAWARGGRPKPAVPAVDPAASKRAGLYVINKDDVNQSWVLMGMLAGKRNDPDYYALSVMNGIMGGGMSSRMFNNIRSDEGLAYAVGSNWSAGWDRPGIFTAMGGTKSQTTLKILDSLKREIRNMAAGEPKDDEFIRAKDAILKGMAFDFDSTQKIVARLTSYEYYSYPRDYLQRYRENIDKVTKADVARVARQYLNTDQFAVLVMGKEQDFEKPLSSIGQPVAIDITIPNPKQQAPTGAAQ